MECEITIALRIIKDSKDSVTIRGRIWVDVCERAGVWQWGCRIYNLEFHTRIETSAQSQLEGQ
jgi:hypothetical protein